MSRRSSGSFVAVAAVLVAMTPSACGSAGANNSDGGTGGQGGQGSGGTQGAGGRGGSTGSGGDALTSGRRGQGGGGGSDGTPGTGGIGNFGGAGGSACDAIATAYGVALGSAKSCSNATGRLPCQTLVDSTLICHCKTYVDNAAGLLAIAGAWVAAGCTRVCNAACPATPTSAQCVTAGDGAATICNDVF